MRRGTSSRWLNALKVCCAGGLMWSIVCVTGGSRESAPGWSMTSVKHRGHLLALGEETYRVANRSIWQSRLWGITFLLITKWEQQTATVMAIWAGVVGVCPTRRAMISYSVESPWLYINMEDTDLIMHACTNTHAHCGQAEELIFHNIRSILTFLLKICRFVHSSSQSSPPLSRKQSNSPGNSDASCESGKSLLHSMNLLLASLENKIKM